MDSDLEVVHLLLEVEVDSVQDGTVEVDSDQWGLVAYIRVGERRHTDRVGLAGVVAKADRMRRRAAVLVVGGLVHTQHELGQMLELGLILG
jgi:hypothetical protein